VETNATLSSMCHPMSARMPHQQNKIVKRRLQTKTYFGHNSSRSSHNQEKQLCVGMQ
jgi:hypothetical protein